MFQFQPAISESDAIKSRIDSKSTDSIAEQPENTDVVELSQDALLLNNKEMAPLLIEIAKMGPRPRRTGNKEVDLHGFFAWNEKLEKDVLGTKYGGGKFDWLTDYTPEPRQTADAWYYAFSQMRRLRLYETAGYEVIGMESVLYSDVGWQHLFLLVKK